MMFFDNWTKNVNFFIDGQFLNVCDFFLLRLYLLGLSPLCLEMFLKIEKYPIVAGITQQVISGLVWMLLDFIYQGPR